MTVFIPEDDSLERHPFLVHHLKALELEIAYFTADTGLIPNIIVIADRLNPQGSDHITHIMGMRVYSIRPGGFNDLFHFHVAHLQRGPRKKK